MNYIKGKTYYTLPNYRTLPELLRHAVDKFHDQLAVTFRDKFNQEPTHKTYAELLADVKSLSAAWSEFGKAESRIAIIGENSYPWMVSYLASVEGQGTVIPLDRLLKSEEIIQLMQRAEADFFCIDAQIFLSLVDQLSEMPALDYVQLMNVKRLNPKQLETLENTLATLTCRIGRFEDLLAAGQSLLNSGYQVKLQPIDPETPNFLIFTSGTTAMSKGVLLCHRSLTSDVAALHGFINFPNGLRTLSLLPLNHTFENTCGFLAVLSIGGHIHVCDGLRYIQQNMQEYRIQMIVGVPAVFDAFYRKIQAEIRHQKKEKTVRIARCVTRGLRKLKIDLRRRVFKNILSALGGEFSLAFAGAAPMEAEQIRFFEDIGVHIFQGYGLTETSPVAAGCNDFIFIPGTVGHPVPGVEIKIDQTEPGQPGEILIRGPITMCGYYRDPQATAEVLQEDGWFRSGDLGILDPKTGALSITGRVKSVIVLENGKKVFPEEIEFLFKQKGFDLLKDSMVFAQHDEQNQLVLSVKFVVDPQKLDQMDTLDQHHLQTRLADMVNEVNLSIPSFKRIKTYMYSFKDLITTTTLKVKRNAEIDRLDRLKKAFNLKWNQLTGRNLDELESNSDDTSS